MAGGQGQSSLEDSEDGVGKQNAHTLLVGLENGTVALENNLAASPTVKHGMLYGPAIPVLGVYQETQKHVLTW